MTTATALSLRPTGRERWAVEARHPDGRVRKMSATFPFCRDEDEAYDRVATKIHTDADFCRQWEGWLFVAIPLHRALKVRKLAASS